MWKVMSSIFFLKVEILMRCKGKFLLLSMMLFLSPFMFEVVMAGSGDVRAGEAKIYSPSDLVENANKFNGMHVTVSGYVVIRPGDWRIFDSKEAASAKQYLGSLGLYIPRAENIRYYSGYVAVITGTFRKNLCDPANICLQFSEEPGIVLDRDVNFNDEKIWRD